MLSLTRWIVDHWHTFEDRAFHEVGRIERRIRSLPNHVRIRPRPFDRRIFRVFCFTTVALGVIGALPTRRQRVAAILGLIGLLIALLAIFALIELWPRVRD